jgi:lipopolysaccharide/colanic/teichoic acid biosynthesis glycosyltransferase
MVIVSEKSLIEDLVASPTVEVVAFSTRRSRSHEPLRPGRLVDLRSVLSDEMARFVSSRSPLATRCAAGGGLRVTGRLPIVHLMEGWELTVPLSGRGSYVQTKRVADTLAVLLVAPLALVLGLLIAAGIAMESRGPVIFRQRRIGRDGKPFMLYKFRTMRHEPNDEARFASPGDDRLTRVGRVLRRIRIDELPQLWNVLIGDLSLVGPRPEQGAFSDRFSETIPSRTAIWCDGITGWAQVNLVC